MPKPNIREFYRDDAYKTMGEQYNNLGNIMQGSSGIWPGQEAIGWNKKEDRALKAFATVEDGVAAQAFLLERYVNRLGDKTFRQIISRYAPPNENNVDNYTNHVAGRVDKIAHSLGYTGPTITGKTDLQAAFADRKNGDIILAATVKAMNEVEVGAASDRLAPADKVLGAVKNKYRQTYGGYVGYSKAIGQSPKIVKPNKKKKGVVEGDEPEHTPDDKDIDNVGDDMFTQFLSMLGELFKKIFEMIAGVFSSQPKTADPAADLDVRKLVSTDLLTKLGATGTGMQADIVLNASFDLDHNGHITQVDIPLIRDQLKASNVTIPANADNSAVLTAYAQQLVKQPTPQR